MKRVAALVLAAALLAAGCGDSQRSGSSPPAFPDSTAPGTDGPPSNEPDPGCYATHPIRLDVPSSLGPFVTACDSPDRLSARITNHSAGVLAIQAQDFRTQWAPADAPEDFVDRAVVTAVPAGQVLGQYQLLPGHTVVVSSPSAPMLSLSFPLGQSATAFAAATVARWVDGFGVPRSVQLLQAVQGCAAGAADLLSGSGPWEDALRTGIQTVPQCRTVIQAARNLADDRAVFQAADDMVSAASRSRVWDDLARLVGRAAVLIPR